MAVSLFTFVDLFARQLVTLDHLLAKGAEHAKAQGQAPDAILDWRLIDDMQPLRFQAAVVCNFSRAWTARVAGLEAPQDYDYTTLDLSGFKAAIAEAKAWLTALTPEQFAGRDDVPLTVQIGTGMEPTLPASQWLTVFATTNLYFHLSTAYGILRHHGVQIGKIDLFASGL
ncbi:MAG: DUF1993 domain-containing protein [Proteobacteria bacterium]|nr:DUF1993 domain-containing protein [Pseudomonadota bacterium]